MALSPVSILAARCLEGSSRLPPTRALDFYRAMGFSTPPAGRLFIGVFFLSCARTVRGGIYDTCRDLNQRPSVNWDVGVTATPPGQQHLKTAFFFC